jgi:hypothetical protein
MNSNHTCYLSNIPPEGATEQDMIVVVDNLVNKLIGLTMLICSSKDGVRLWDTMYGWPRVFEDSWNSWELMNLKLFLKMTSNHR